ncbi:MAG: glycosyltransferase family 1 protein [Verrucomicrobia bacterium]|nr:MAG: glycosyltransferase family 1 protein [Verrucomicrobiota bacterium]
MHEVRGHLYENRLSAERVERCFKQFLLKTCDLTQFYSPVSGGVRRYIEQKVAFVREHTDGEHILIVPGNKTHKNDEGRIRVYTIASPLISRTSRYRCLTKLRLVQQIFEEEKPDLIESGDPYQLAWKAVQCGRNLRIPVTGFYHSHFPDAYIRSVARYLGQSAIKIAEKLSRRYIRNLYNRFARTLVPAPALTRLLYDWGVKNVEHIDLGVDVDTFTPRQEDRAPLRRELGIPENALLLLYVGRLAQEKNVKMLLEAFRLLHKRFPNKYHLLVVGDGRLRKPLLRLKKTTSAIHWVHFCKEAPRLAQFYRAADLFVHPSINETFGLVALESQACGTPVIGIQGSYMDRIIFNNQIHWARENTFAALAEAIEEMGRQDLRGAGLQASHQVRNKYAWKFVFQRLFSIYREVVTNYKS